MPEADARGGVEHLSTREGYDRWATIYDGEDNPLIALEQPRVDALLGSVKGLRIADIGCGTGRHTLRLAESGAEVTGVDFAPEMLARAQAKMGGERVRWLQHDLALPLPLADATFDRVVCGLVLDHIADLRGLFSETGRICKPEGWIVVSVMHPAMMLRGVQARFVDPASGCEVRPASCPHQISDYVMAALQSGLHIEHLREHAVDDALAARSARASKYLYWPMLLMMRLQRS